MKHIFRALLLLVFLPACNLLNMSDMSNFPSEWVIIPAEVAEAQEAAYYAGVATDAYWTPTERQVYVVQDAVIDYLEEIGETEILDNLENYKIQFFGYESEGEAFIYGNYFCDDWDMDWHNDLVAVLDGGSCYFQAKYQQDGGELIWVMINGEA